LMVRSCRRRTPGIFVTSEIKGGADGHSGATPQKSASGNSSPLAMYSYGMGRARDHKDVAQDLARELADLAAHFTALKGEANVWLSDASYDALRHRLEDAHASVEAAAVEARRRVRLNEEQRGQ
jgi:hypothetical protein